MPVLAMTLPVPPGQAAALEQHIAEATVHPELEETLSGFGIQHESWHIQETPQGDLLILVFQADDPAAMLEAFASSDKPLPVWQKRSLKQTLGVDLSEPPPGPPPRTIFSWPSEEG